MHAVCSLSRASLNVCVYPLKRACTCVCVCVQCVCVYVCVCLYTHGTGMAGNPPFAQFPFFLFPFLPPLSKEWREIRDLFVDVNEKILAPLDFFLSPSLSLNLSAHLLWLSHDSHYPPSTHTHTTTISLLLPFSRFLSLPTLNPKPSTPSPLVPMYMHLGLVYSRTLLTP